MVFSTKESQDAYIAQTIKNIVHDQTSFNLMRQKFTSFQGAYGYLLEEVEESEDALRKVKNELEMFWDLIKGNESNAQIALRARLLLEESIALIQESVHIAAVAKKMVYQFERGDLQ